ncbi:MAG TPA: AAA family ATPase [Desulfobulbaceae bacterium]|nr:AAA family ATPase [Desulfobulbaceae bacterium]
MIDRDLTQSIRKATAAYPVVTLTGPRQSGKTTLARHIFPDYQYASLEDTELRTFAQEDPKGFLRRFNRFVVFDEVQRVPELFSFIQIIVDEEDTPGRFILTGSQNFLLIDRINQSLAGRSAIFHLLPFSQNELTRAEAFPLGRIGKGFPPARSASDVELNTRLFTGFYPRIHDKKLEPQDWLKNYYKTYVERDVRDILNIGDLEAFQRFVGLCAGRNGQLLNLSSLASDCGITHTTSRRWLSVLEASFLVALLRPHYQNFRKRLVKAPKLYFLDTGLLCYLLRIKSADELAFHASRGAVFESFVVSELYKKALHRGIEPDCYFWRDSAGHEVDIIIDTPPRPVPLEVKSAMTVAADFFKGIEYWRKLSGAGEDSPAALIYGGDNSFIRNGVHLYPWWNF